MSTSSQGPGERYADEATALDSELDIRLAEVRRQSDAGLITVREAADLRVVVLEHHIRQIKALRIKHFGESS